MATVSDIWTPVELRVGDHVRVRVSLECRYCLNPDFPRCYQEALLQDGREGRIAEIESGDCSCCLAGDEDPSHPDHVSHNIWVRWDDDGDDYGLSCEEERRLPGVFAASELILLERAP